MLAAMTAAPLWVFLVFWTMSYDVYCGQTAVWIKMPLGMEVGLGHGDFVFDGNPAPPRKKGTAPHPVFRSSPGDDLVHWKSICPSARPYVHKKFFRFRPNLVCG